jgi:hypothetical protein
VYISAKNRSILKDSTLITGLIVAPRETCLQSMHPFPPPPRWSTGVWSLRLMISHLTKGLCAQIAYGIHTSNAYTLGNKKNCRYEQEHSRGISLGVSRMNVKGPFRIFWTIM